MAWITPATTGQATPQARRNSAMPTSRAAATARGTRRTPAAAGVRRVPRAVAAALLVGMAELRRACGVACPVVAGVIHAIGVRAALGCRAGQDVVLVRHVAD